MDDVVMGRLEQENVELARPMTESDFISRIDCAFPYEDEEASAALVHEASQISTNACFMIGEELSRPPRSASPSIEGRLRTLSLLRKCFEHPMRDAVLGIVELRIRGGTISLDHALGLLQAIEPHRNQFCAMNIVYFACDAMEEDLIDSEWNRIRDRWNATDASD